MLRSSAPPHRPGIAVLLASVLLSFATLAAPSVSGDLPQADRSAAQDDRSAAQDDSLKVMSFNIRYGTARDGDNGWEHRRAAVIEVIGAFRPDVLGVQEALRFQLDELAAAMPRYEEIGVGRDDGVEAGEYAAILVDRSRLEVLEQGTFWFSDTPSVPGSKSWGNEIPRICSWARLRDRDSEHTFYVYNVHWDHQSQPSREGSAELLMQRIAQRGPGEDPVLVTGDFNAGESNPAFQRLLAAPVVKPLEPPADGRRRATGSHLIDTFRALRPEAREVGTFNGFEGRTDGDKIDAVLASGEWEVLAAEIVRTAPEGRYPSDHFPVGAALRLRPPEPYSISSTVQSRPSARASPRSQVNRVAPRLSASAM